MQQNVSELDASVRRENEVAAGWLLWYEDRLAAYRERREQVLYSSSPCLSSTVPGGKNYVADPTGGKGGKMADLDNSDEARWLRLVHEIEQKLSTREQVFLRLRRKYRRRRGRNGWFAAVQWEYPHEMAQLTGRKPKEFWVSHPNTFTQWWHRIVDKTVREAIRRGLPFNKRHSDATRKKCGKMIAR